MELMDQKIKQKWVAALKSGDYKKTVGFLLKLPHTTDEKYEYCALGVLVKMYCDYKELEIRNFTKYNNVSLAEDVRKWAGLERPDPNIVTKGTKYIVSVTQANDKLKLSFDEIADAIDKSL